MTKETLTKEDAYNIIREQAILELYFDYPDFAEAIRNHLSSDAYYHINCKKTTLEELEQIAENKKIAVKKIKEYENQINMKMLEILNKGIENK